MGSNMWTFKNSAIPVDVAVRDRIKATLCQLIQEKQSGFFDLELLQEGETEATKLAQSMRSQFETFCVLGIGGSSLGAQAVLGALAPHLLENHDVLFFDNVDAKSFYRKLNGIPNLKKTLWILISKSGGTVETLAQADFLDQYLMEKEEISLKQKAVVITEDKKSPLCDWAKNNNVPRLEVPVNIGGRFSVLSVVGLFLFSLVGLKTEEMLKGAADCLQDPSLVESVATQFAMSCARQETATYFFSYCDDLFYWGHWLQQLWSESLGKKTTRDGKKAPPLSVPIPCRGASDQHSILQQMIEGTQKKMICLLRVSDAERGGLYLVQPQLLTDDLLVNRSLGDLLAAEADAIEQALNEAQVATLSLSTESLNERSVGHLLMAFQLVVAILGLYNDIDPFDQPGVERGKVLTRQYLSRKTT